MGKESQKSALPNLFHFVRVRAAFQPHVKIEMVSRRELSIYQKHLRPTKSELSKREASEPRKELSSEGFIR